MPTPFSHIVLAERILADERLPNKQRQLLRETRPAFLLGNTAPDLGSLSDRARHETHFFHVPIMKRLPAHLRLLHMHPEMADSTLLAKEQSAFIAGYLAHLWLDQAWILKIFQPFFGMVDLAGAFRERLIEHNLLRAYVDQDHRRDLPEGLGEQLRQVNPDSWLPFATDENIRRWRDSLAAQVSPEGKIHTIKVFADRLKISTQEFSQRLDSKDQMQSIFSRLPPNHLESFFEVALDYSIELVHYYLEGDPQSAPRSSQPLQKLEVKPDHGEKTP